MSSRRAGHYFEDLYYTEIGNGPPLIALHGFGETSFSWRYLVPDLAKTNTVYLFDLRGHGKSKIFSHRSFSLQAQSSTICEFILAKDLRNITLVGHSMGGAIALLTAMRLNVTNRPRLSALILIDSIGFPQPLPLSFRLMRIPLLARIIFKFLPKSIIARLILQKAFFDKTKIAASTIADYAANFARSDGVDVLISTAQQMVPSDTLGAISTLCDLQVPTLIISGKEDKIVPRFVSSALNALVLHSRLATIDHCGHVPHEEQPEETTKIIAEFIRELGQRAWTQ